MPAAPQNQIPQQVPPLVLRQHMALAVEVVPPGADLGQRQDAGQVSYVLQPRGPQGATEMELQGVVDACMKLAKVWLRGENKGDCSNMFSEDPVS